MKASTPRPTLPASPAASLLKPLGACGQTFRCIDLARVLPDSTLDRLPRTLRILFENAALHAPARLRALVQADGTLDRGGELDFFPARWSTTAVRMQRA